MCSGSGSPQVRRKSSKNHRLASLTSLTIVISFETRDYHRSTKVTFYRVETAGIHSGINRDRKFCVSFVEESLKVRSKQLLPPKSLSYPLQTFLTTPWTISHAQMCNKWRNKEKSSDVKLKKEAWISIPSLFFLYRNIIYLNQFKK